MCKPYDQNRDGISETFVRFSALSWMIIGIDNNYATKFCYALAVFYYLNW